MSLCHTLYVMSVEQVVKSQPTFFMGFFFFFYIGNIFPVAVQGNNEVSMWDMETGDRRFTLWASSAPPLSELQVWSLSLPVSVVWWGLQQPQTPCCASLPLPVCVAMPVWHQELALGFILAP